MAHRFLMFSGIALAAALSACAPPLRRATATQLQTRSAYDLACPPPQLQLYHLDARVKVVEGCGHRATYLETCDARGGCTWRLEPPNPQQLALAAAAQCALAVEARLRGLREQPPSESTRTIDARESWETPTEP